VRIYKAVRDWVDGLWARPGLKVKGTLFFAALPVVLAGMFIRHPLVTSLAVASAVLWTAFVAWRGAIWFDAECKRIDQQRRGR
jgi:hypothetical protein